MYSLSLGRQVLLDNRELGEPGLIIVDVFQRDVLALKDPGTTSAKLKVGDYVFATKDHVVVVEEKRIPDLLTSWGGRRLQRQLRRIKQANPDGINILALRASGSVPSLNELLWLDIPPELTLDLLKWQALGGLLGFVPYYPKGVLETLQTWRAILKPGQHLYSVLAGTEVERMPEKMTPTGYALRRLFKGVGPKLGAAWAAAGQESLVQALAMPDRVLKDLGARQSVLDQRGELH
mgnify:CR=1 FL=1